MEFDLSRYTQNFKKEAKDDEWKSAVEDIYLNKLRREKVNWAQASTLLGIFRAKPYFLYDIWKNCLELGKHYGRKPEIYFWGQVRKAKTGSTKK